MPFAWSRLLFGHPFDRDQCRPGRVKVGIRPVVIGSSIPDASDVPRWAHELFRGDHSLSIQDVNQSPGILVRLDLYLFLLIDLELAGRYQSAFSFGLTL